MKFLIETSFLKYISYMIVSIEINWDGVFRLFVCPLMAMCHRGGSILQGAVTATHWLCTAVFLCELFVNFC